jgi:hypothetical protein
VQLPTALVADIDGREVRARVSRPAGHQLRPAARVLAGHPHARAQPERDGDEVAGALVG